jgi:methyltransferase family protein
LPDRILRRVSRALVRREPGAAALADTLTVPVREDPAELFPGLWDRTIQLGQCGWRWGHPYNDNALIFLCHLAAAGYRPIVEFGTFDGRTAFNLALNAGDSTVTTIDLPGADDGSNVEGRLYGGYDSGACIRRAPEAVRARIREIKSDSRQVDLSHLYGTVRLVFIDGGHDEDVCRHDTDVALKLACAGGVVIWDDYTPYWPGVRKVVEEVALHRELFHFPRLGLVVHLMEL